MFLFFVDLISLSHKVVINGKSNSLNNVDEYLSYISNSCSTHINTITMTSSRSNGLVNLSNFSREIPSNFIFMKHIYKIS